MARATSSPLERVEETAGPAVAEAFETLGNETRLTILLALWESYDPLEADNSVSFTELRNRVGIRQGGQFNYHLDKVVGQIVERTEGGYALRTKGLKLVETVLAWITNDQTLDVTEIDVPCHLCGGRTAITYQQDGELYHVCLDCDGNFDWGENVCSSAHEFEGDEPVGAPLSGIELSPAGLRDRTPEEVFAAARYTLYGNHLMKSAGICDECNGVVETSVDACSEHDATAGPCPSCGQRWPIDVTFVCAVCKEGGGTTPTNVATYHPAVIAFLYEHGVEFGTSLHDYKTYTRNRRLLGEAISIEEDVLETDPLRVAVTFRSDHDAIQVVLDEHMDVEAVDDDPSERGDLPGRFD